MMSLNLLPLIDTYTPFPVTTDPDTHRFFLLLMSPVFFPYPGCQPSAGSVPLSSPLLPTDSPRAVDGHFLPGLILACRLALNTWITWS